MRDAVPADFDRLTEIYLEAFPGAHPHMPDECWKDHVGELRVILPHWPTYVFEAAGVPVGFICLVDEYISDFYILPSAQRQGIGTKLMNRAKEREPLLTLDVFVENERAVSFYSAAGFVVESQYEESCSKRLKLKMRWTRQ